VLSERPPVTHIAIVAGDSTRRDALAAALDPVCPVHVLAASSRPIVADTALCVVVDIDLAAPRTPDEIALFDYLAGCPALPRIFVVDSADERPDAAPLLARARTLGATETISRPVEAESVLAILSDVKSRAFEDMALARGGAAGRGAAAAGRVLAAVFQASKRLLFDEVKAEENLVLDALHDAGIRAWLDIVRQHHSATYRHSLLVTGFAVSFAQALDMRIEDQRRIARAALLHDIGKALIPLSILDKPNALTAEEMKTLRWHPVLGHKRLQEQGGFPEEILDCVRHHHEMLDGSGYPDHLKGEEISDLVRVITLADIFSALVEPRAYKPALPVEEALRIMARMKGKLDHDLLKRFRAVAVLSGH